MAVYKVKNEKTGEEVLVETRTKAGAINHVSKNDYTATSLNTSELVREVKAGKDIEVVGEEPEATGKEKAAEEVKAAAKSNPANPAANAKATNPIKKAA